VPPGRGLLFLNPRSGSLGPVERDELRALADREGLGVVEVTPKSDVSAAVKSALEDGMRSFIVAGGDGTIHHVAQSLVGTPGQLGIVPLGTVNHLARDLRIPFDWREAFEIALRGEIRQIDAGRVNDRYFLNSVMIGIFPTVAQLREAFRTTHSKWRAYARALRLALRQFAHVSLVVEIEGNRVEVVKTQLFIVSVNSYDLSQAGVVSLKTSLDDGRLTIYTLSFKSRMGFIAAAARYFLGKAEKVEGFRRVRARQLRIDSAHRRIRVAVDGEPIDFRPPVQIVAVPASLLVRAP
jgi:diacylglycerol kinase family enzyme